DALDGVFAVTDAHDDAALRVRGDFEHGWHGVRRDRQRMIANRLERVGQAGEDAFAVVRNHRGLAVHDLASGDDLAAEGLADRLMAEADAEQGHAARGGLDEADRDASFRGGTRAGRDDDALWAH